MNFSPAGMRMSAAHYRPNGVRFTPNSDHIADKA